MDPHPHNPHRWAKIPRPVVHNPRLFIQLPACIAKAEVKVRIALASDLTKAVVNDVIQYRTAVVNHIPHRALMLGQRPVVLSAVALKSILGSAHPTY